MITTNSDRPHPVPPIAYLRYKENWFFLIFDKTNDIFGAIHIVSEPIFERVRFACHLSVQGELFKHGSEVPFPENFAFAPELGDGKFKASFVKAHEQIDLSLVNDDIEMHISQLNRGPVFNFEDYDYANPDKPSLKEVTNLASNQQFVHMQQGLYSKGSVTVKNGKAAGKTFMVDALGYRDHSRCVRADNYTLKHFWTGLHFENHIFGVMSVTNILRPNSPTNCGYVYDKEGGLRSLRNIAIEGRGEGPGNLPEEVVFTLDDIYGEKFNLVASINNRFAHVPLYTEKPGALPFVYAITENFVPIHFNETNETGIGLVEIGWSETKS
jgi:hypothetical protein